MTAKRTPLYEKHLASGARMVDFCGWELPLHYGSQLDEHHRVRRDAGVFDVSHMTVIDVGGREPRPYLRHLLAADVAALSMPGRALYACMLNEQGGAVDDVIVYWLAETLFRVVANAKTRTKDLQWMVRQADDYDVDLTTRDDLAMLAVQGPAARARLLNLLGGDQRGIVERLRYFEVAVVFDMCVARTGYTGEDGFEIILPSAKAPGLWQDLIEAGVAPAGLGARDTLRLEAGLNLYGSDMDEGVSPLECGLDWTVALDPGRDFVGRAALIEQRARGITRQRIGLIAEGRGVLRANDRIFLEDGGEGEVTSGTFSPTLGAPIALGRVPASAAERCEVESRGRRLAARVVRPPFVRHGKPRH